MQALPPPARRRPFAAEPGALLLAGALLGAAAPAAFAQTQAPATTAAAHHDIPAGPLDPALNRFAAQTGIMLTIDGSLTAGKATAGLHGAAGIEDGLRRLLAGTGLEAVPRGGKEYTLRRQPAPSSGETTLQAVTVSAQAIPWASESTESTRAYTTNAVSPTATPLGLTLRETPQTISVLTHQRIEDQALTNVRETLQQLPGIQVADMGGSRYSVMSRGYAIDTYQLDGIPTRVDMTTQHVSQSLAEMVIYDRVEVLRGAGGLMSGAGDASGTLNLVRKRPTAAFQGYASASAGSWDKYRTEADISGALNESGSLRGRAAAAYQQNGSFVDYARGQKQVLFATLEADLSASTLLNVGVDYQKNVSRGGVGNGVGLPLFYSSGRQTDFSRSTSLTSRDNKDETEAVHVFSSLKQQLGKGWELQLAADHLRSERSYAWVGARAYNTTINQSTGVMTLQAESGDAVQRQTGVDLRLQGPFQLFGREHDFAAGFSYSDYEDKTDYGPKTATGVPGGNFNLYTWAHLGKPADQAHARDSDTHIQEKGFYAAVRLKPADDLAVIVGSRLSEYTNDYQLAYRNGTYSYSEYAKESNVVTPYLGVVYDLAADHALYASYATIFRPQYQRDRNGAMLDPRQGDNIEVGLKSQFLGGKVNSAIAIYRINQDNLAESDAGYLVPGTTASAYRAVKGAKTNGIDMEIGGEVLPGWNVSASYTFSRTEDAEGERIRTTFPQHIVKLWNTYRLPGAWERLTVGGGVNWQSRIEVSGQPWWASTALNGKQDAYAVVNLMARYAFSKQFSATLNINNLFDEKYFGSLDSTFYTGYYGDPRNVMLTAKYSF